MKKILINNYILLECELKMLLISHRGNLKGPNPQRENDPKYIQEALDIGYSVEIDMRVFGKDIWLGHDNAQYQVTDQWLKDRQIYLWIHCKNREALQYCLGEKLHCFWHDTDDYTITSMGFVWAYPGKSQAGDLSILVLPERHHSLKESSELPCFGICSDFVSNIKNINIL